MIEILQFVAIFLLSIGVLFVLIELRSNFDRSILFFGTAAILLCSFTCIDLFILPKTSDPKMQVYWVKIQHILVSLALPLITVFVLHLTDSYNKKFVTFLTIGTALFSILFASNLMLSININPEPFHNNYIDNLKITPLYLFLFAPAFILYTFFIIRHILRRIDKVSQSQRKILLFNIFGFSMMMLFGSFDVLMILRIIPPIVPSWVLFGILTYVGINSFLFTDHLSRLIRDHKKVFQELQDAYKDLEKASTLKQLGQSTAIINHEIKNYLFIISGNATLLERTEHLNPKSLNLIKAILETTQHLTTFSQDILDLSRAEVIREKQRIVLSQIIERCISSHFPRRKECFTFEGVTDLSIHGDWLKLDHVFVNLLKNSFEASASKINVKFVTGPYTVCISIDDNGEGCDVEKIHEIFNAFYTTKKGKGGTGLGLSIVRAIVEAHGGHINAYTKNSTTQNVSGMVMNLTFPLFDTDKSVSLSKQKNLILVKENLDGLANIIRVFQNVNIQPTVIQNASELEKFESSGSYYYLIANPNTASLIKKNFPGFQKICTVQAVCNCIYAIDKPECSPEPFSEEFVLTKLFNAC